MDEIEIISSEENKAKAVFIEELQNYKRELKEMIKFWKKIIKRQMKK